MPDLSSAQASASVNQGGNMAKAVEIRVRNALTGNESKLSSAVATLEKHVIRSAQERLDNGEDADIVRNWADREIDRYLRSFIAQNSVHITE